MTETHILADPSVAEGVIAGFLADPTERLVALQQLVASADYAATVAPSAWGVTLYKDIFRLNVGMVEVFVVGDGFIRFNCVGVAGEEPFIGPRFERSSYLSVPDPQCAFVGPLAEFAVVGAVLRQYHRNFIDTVGRKKNGEPVAGSGITKSHSAGLLAYARAFIASPDRGKGGPSPILLELQDTAIDIAHGRFQEWRAQNPTAKFLTLETRSKANLHGTACQHLGNAEWLADPATRKYSLTRKRKILGTAFGSLATWAAEREVAVRLCSHCLRDGLVSEADLEATTNILVAIAQSLEAIEGQKRESLALSYGRSLKLRDAALTRANGICAACSQDFSRLFSGLGLRALQVHHINQLSARAEPSATKVEDLAVLCANCHAMVHASPDAPMSVEELRNLHGTRSAA